MLENNTEGFDDAYLVSDILQKPDESQDTVKAAEKKKKNRFYGEFFDWIDSMVISVFCIILVFTFVVRLVGVKGESMRETLQNNDRLFISDLMYTPAVGDIVVVSRDYLYETVAGTQEPIIKRIIATAGQVIDVREGVDGAYHVYVDGVEKQEDYIRESMKKYYSKTVDFPYTVPDGHVFVMGDNRNNSRDSRSYDVGAVDVRYILGRVILRVFPFNKIGVPDNE